MGRRSKLEARYPNLRREIAARLRKLRDAVNPNASEMARSVGLTAQTWYNYEVGRSSMPPEIGQRLCKVYRVDFNWLIGGWTSGLSPMLRAALAPDEEPTAESACRERRAGRRP